MVEKVRYALLSQFNLHWQRIGTLPVSLGEGFSTKGGVSEHQLKLQFQQPRPWQGSFFEQQYSILNGGEYGLSCSHKSFTLSRSILEED